MFQWEGQEYQWAGRLGGGGGGGGKVNNMMLCTLMYYCCVWIGTKHTSHCSNAGIEVCGKLKFQCLIIA